MSNSKRGLIDIEFNGEVKQLRFPNSVMRSLQERFKVQAPHEVWTKVGEWSADDWLDVMLRGLQKGSDPDITKEQVDDLLVGTEYP